jgi:hypothetical protein
VLPPSLDLPICWTLSALFLWAMVPFGVPLNMQIVVALMAQVIWLTLAHWWLR